MIKENGFKKTIHTETTWFVYILHCSDNTLYTGVTTNLDRRLKEHNSSQGGARYTRPRRPVQLVYAEPADSRGAACRREYRIKQMSRNAKEELIDTDSTILGTGCCKF